MVLVAGIAPSFGEVIYPEPIQSISVDYVVTTFTRPAERTGWAC